MEEIKMNENQMIIFEDLKIIDIIRSDGFSGCRCSTSNDRNRYDKESKTIICPHYSSCLGNLLKHAEKHILIDIKEHVKCQYE